MVCPVLFNGMNSMFSLHLKPEQRLIRKRNRYMIYNCYLQMQKIELLPLEISQPHQLSFEVAYFLSLLSRYL